MDALSRVTDEFRRLDDELAAAVTLPSVDDVIRHAGSTNRASTAAAVAVIAVGALGGVTGVAQIVNAPVVQVAPVAAASGDTVPVLPESSSGEAPVPVEEVVPAPVDDPPARRAPERERVTAPPSAAPVSPTTTPVQPTTSATGSPIDEGGEDTTTPGETTPPTDGPTTSPTLPGEVGGDDTGSGADTPGSGATRGT